MRLVTTLFRGVSLVCAGLVLSTQVAAQPYPNKVVRVIVPFAPGSGVDAVIRLVTPKLGEMMGQQFIVDNRGGASGNIATDAVARAAPDGYTLLAIAASQASNVALFKDLKFDLIRDFAPVAMIASAPFALAIHPSIPAKSVAELIALAKSQPGKLTYASTGQGSAPHLTAELFKMQAGVDILHVPYKGSQGAIPDLIGGQVSMMFASTVVQPAKDGRLRGLATTGAKRGFIAPDWPTIAESGLPGFEAGTWFGLLAPAKTPREIVIRLNEAVAKIIANPDIVATLRKQGYDPVGGSPDEVGAKIKQEIERATKVVAAIGLKPE